MGPDGVGVYGGQARHLPPSAALSSPVPNLAAASHSSDRIGSPPLRPPIVVHAGQICTRRGRRAKNFGSPPAATLSPHGRASPPPFFFCVARRRLSPTSPRPVAAPFRRAAPRPGRAPAGTSCGHLYLTDVRVP
ncbi:hypothetical protein PR202_gb26061 [Eleusine coracana subsp. coracana]|uniref:Uncharacterized protein n=1 Tax=Eleusine coracana subsp. coracana TaxID=191504 RepID=A0AAV5FQ78_ELECO|nr:hypothetical protein PR202_gb26061 [Eleusine coracana subsp. coracana]